MRDEEYLATHHRHREPDCTFHAKLGLHTNEHRQNPESDAATTTGKSGVTILDSTHHDYAPLTHAHVGEELRSVIQHRCGPSCRPTVQDKRDSHEHYSLD